MKIINIALTGKGGIGASTTAVNLYIELKSQDKQVLMIDLDENKHTSKFFEARQNHNDKNMSLDNIAELEHILNSDITNKNFDYIILDSGKYVSDLNSYALQISDLIIVPTTDSESDFIQAMDFISNLENTVLSENDYTEIKILVNRVRYNSTKFHKELKEQYQDINRIGVFETIVSENKACKMMALSGKGAKELTTNKRVQADIEGLANEVQNATR